MNSSTNEDEYDLSIMQGYSRDGKPHLNQFNIGRSVNREDVPGAGVILERNTADTTWNTTLIDELLVYVADSAVISLVLALDLMVAFAAVRKNTLRTFHILRMLL
jgi:transposase